MKYYIFFTFLLLKSFCFSQDFNLFDKKSNTNDSKIFLQELNQISNKKDYAFWINTPLLIPEASLTSSLMTNVGLNFSFVKFNIGRLDFGYSTSYFITGLQSISPGFNPRTEIDHSNSHLIFNIPIFTKEKVQPRYIDLIKQKSNSSGKLYYTELNSTILDKFYVRVGKSREFSETSNASFYPFISKIYPVIRFNNDMGGSSKAWFTQNTSVYKFGVCFTRAINTSLRANNALNEMFYGSSTSLINFYFDINIFDTLTYSNNYYSYSTKSNLNYSGDYTFHSGVEDLTNYSELKKIGFDFGFEYDKFGTYQRWNNYTINLEIGSRPGYYYGFLNSFYAKIKFISFGLGYFSRRVNR